jgi:hypothetical protein
MDIPMYLLYPPGYPWSYLGYIMDIVVIPAHGLIGLFVLRVVNGIEMVSLPLLILSNLAYR